MSQTVSTLEPLPFSRPQKETLAGWVAGLLFGLLCIGAGVMVVIAVAVMGLSLAVGNQLGRWFAAPSGS